MALQPDKATHAAVPMSISTLPSLVFSTCTSSSSSTIASPIRNTSHTLPPFLWALGFSLEELVFLWNTMLVGGQSPYIAKRANLKRLIMVDNNALERSIPEEVEELTMLEQLVLSRNGHTEGADRVQQLAKAKGSIGKHQGGVAEAGSKPQPIIRERSRLGRTTAAKLCGSCHSLEQS
ncbi:hypothetical protein L7F22_050752 [Adiantum nelumboides]|nr:hypothetical protein [Adiantum nelumboides]